MSPRLASSFLLDSDSRSSCLRMRVHPKISSGDLDLELRGCHLKMFVCCSIKSSDRRRRWLVFYGFVSLQCVLVRL
jgi:hypothetical protein